VTEALRIPSTDGVVLEGEWAPAADAVAAAVLCHPHPQYGGSMRAGLMGELFRALPPAGVAALRVNVRGVEGSTGTWAEGVGEFHDVRAALAEVAARVPPTLPVWMVGWSFGGDLALSVRDARVHGWCAIAPPLRSGPDPAGVGTDGRPVHLVLGERDDLVPPAPLVTRAASWSGATVTVVAGADHFFVGRWTAVVEAVLTAVLAGASGAAPER
jgi:alpha/beta superfamily hydrolase